jgi:hypothetical protein
MCEKTYNEYEKIIVDQRFGDKNYYYIGIKNDLFATLRGSNLVHRDLSIALNIVRLKAINKFFSDWTNPIIY